MDPALRTAASGMMAQQLRTEVISNNLANVSTNGYKRQRAVFEDLLYQVQRQPGAQSHDPQTTGLNCSQQYDLSTKRIKLGLDGGEPGDGYRRRCGQRCID